jgi:hypothetical protein
VAAANETIAFVAAGHRLEGRWTAGTAGGAVVAPPHPEYGGRLDHPVVAAASAALAHRGLTTLAFNWSGVGASEGPVSGDPARAEADYGAALDELARRGVASPLVAAGYSFGAATALALAYRVDRLLLVAPPVAMLGAELLRDCPRPVAVVVGDADRYAPVERVRALVPERHDRRLAILSGVDHFFAGERALARLGAVLEEMLA